MQRRLPELFEFSRWSPRSARGAFTLLELLVVIVIIGLLATIGLPAIKGMTKSNGIIAANRQLLDDLGYARQRAIADHTTVYVVFVPPTINGFTDKFGNDFTTLNQYTNLYGGIYTTYALLSLRSVGDQPGQPTPHYLTAWRSLPNGIFIATNKFLNITNAANFYNDSFPTGVFPFPIVETNTSPSTQILPYIGFDYQGQLVTGRDEAIPLARGSIFYSRGADGNFQKSATIDVLETPPGNSISISNVVHIDWLTGRARIERQEVQ